MKFYNIQTCFALAELSQLFSDFISKTDYNHSYQLALLTLKQLKFKTI